MDSGQNSQHSQELLRIVDEFLQRRRDGEHVEIAEYATNHPELADSLTELLHGIVGLECVAEGATSPDETGVAQDDTVRTELNGPSELPADFGRYQLVERLGSGSMGVVFMARDKKLGRNVALKIPRVDASDTVALQRFEREARAMATVDHPNLCSVYDVGEYAGQHYLTMAYVPGESLSSLIKEGSTFSNEQAARLIKRVSLAVQAAHDAGVVHRDLKPANIMINEVSEPVVMDFGLALHDLTDDAELTSPGAVIGSPAYMAPEQVAADHSRIGPATDIYALGIVLYELLAERKPFEGSILSVLKQIDADNPTPPSIHRDTVDPELEQICLKAISKQIQDRHHSAADLAMELKRFLDDPRELSSRSQSRRYASLLVGSGLVATLLGTLLLVASGLSPSDDTSGVGTHTADTSADNASPEVFPIAIDDGFVWPDTQPPPAIVPFDTDKARQYQHKWAEHLEVEVVTSFLLTARDESEDTTLSMVLIPPGEFLMGTSEDDQVNLFKLAKSDHDAYASREQIPSEGPQRAVRITKPFWIAETEVTISQFRAFIEDSEYVPESIRDGKGGYGFLDGNDDAWIRDPRFQWNTDIGIAQSDDSPVLNVTSGDMIQFCSWLSQQHSGWTFHLPTEAQWECACRAGSMSLRHCADDGQSLSKYAWFGDNASGHPHPVGQLKPNAFGLYDMYGNAWERVADWFLYSYRGRITNDPPGPARGEMHIARGGSWGSPIGRCRSAYRQADKPTKRWSTLGFRVAATKRPNE